MNKQIEEIIGKVTDGSGNEFIGTIKEYTNYVVAQSQSETIEKVREWAKENDFRGVVGVDLLDDYLSALDNLTNTKEGE